MRELKFRVWDGEKYHHPEATKEESNHYLQFGTDGFWLFNGQGSMVTATEVGGVCEQFTGLKDKNGQEIYENDKMTVQLPAGGFWGNVKIGVVRYESDYGAFIVEWEYSQHQHHKNLTCDIACAGEIIGNIHENPELIAKKQEI